MNNFIVKLLFFSLFCFILFWWFIDADEDLKNAVKTSHFTQMIFLYAIVDFWILDVELLLFVIWKMKYVDLNMYWMSYFLIAVLGEYLFLPCSPFLLFSFVFQVVQFCLVVLFCVLQQ
jgi:hypothetical protein